MTIKLIVGLGNPGVKYVATRHNVGAWYIKSLVERYQKTLKEESKFYGYTSHLTLCNQDIWLLVPTTFMNLSGKAVVAIASFYHIEPNDILIAHDELNLLPGSARLKLGGGHGGHNGIKNIINLLGRNSKFNRLRIGIGHPGNKDKVINFVLSKPSNAEYQLIHSAIDKAVRCTELLVIKDNIKAMNSLHTPHS
ncbi:Peptidyl-tRNA hydrolase [Candidatus Gullanella endobia]|uniref:Peptidyl-tRNA hydrolase n=1 Tax=Candidatus Gullanella endobia TaxID=1070130 RepID=A0A143WQA6_9ENTR|nr:aminoacyl-tRNA hydrolase [Candidatus Gullanella endobia]CUX95873.1 Peptidyl-tRNA hydrolase [Candidatus Gullanella endobia]